MKLFRILLTLSLFGLFGCASSELPTETYYQFTFSKSLSYEDDTLRINLVNPVMSPLRIWLSSAHDSLQASFDRLNPIVLSEKEDTTLIFTALLNFKDDVKYRIAFGSLSKKIKNSPVKLPFPANKSYRIIQGNNTDYTHKTNFSRYAIDFDLRINDTISSASDGYVVGVIDQYKHGGKGSQWRPFGNFITIYDSSSGRYFQYVHLTYQGSLVKLGDHVKSGQPIALSGNTGQTTRPHLHFNCLIPISGKGDVKSIPIDFIEGYIGTKLKKNDRVSN